MKLKILLVWVVAKVLLELFKKPEKAEALKQKLIEATDEKEVKQALIDVGTEILTETVETDLPPEVVEGLIIATTGGQVDEVLDDPKVKGGLFDLIGAVICGIGKLLGFK